MSYEDNIKFLRSFILKIFTEKEFQIQDNLIYIDGGECTGTTTSSKMVVEMVKMYTNATWNREPSLECKKKFINLMTTNGSLLDPKDKVKQITDIFMSDRYINQNNTLYPTLNICDRGILSTFLYQSGILNKDNTIDNIIFNCGIIKKSMRKHKIKLPKISINFISANRNLYPELDKSLTEIEFKRRLLIRNISGETDGMDTLDTVIRVNDVYTDVLIGLNKEIPNFHNVEFKNTINTVSSEVEKIIRGSL